MLPHSSSGAGHGAGVRPLLSGGGSTGGGGGGGGAKDTRGFARCEPEC